MEKPELDSFDPEIRRRTLAVLAAQAGNPPATRPLMNMHLHSFFSFNTLGYSPSHLAWAARREGLYAAALCDFDVLDGLEEFIGAGTLLELRTAVILETRAFFGEYAAMDINSPGEPGVSYIMGAGFPRAPAAGSAAAATLAALRRRAGERNQALTERINARLPEIALDYEKDVVPLSPGGCPTERHLVRAYRLKAETKFRTPQRPAFWAKITGKTPDTIEKLSAQVPALEDVIRSALVKRGGIGYQPPTAKSFPPLDEFIAWVLDCGAMPMIGWLDGTAAAERNLPALLDCLQAKGACALNIIPERNHNIADPAARAIQLKNLEEVVRACERRELPINIGTELNKEGQPFVDDLDCPALRAYRETFLRGARVMVGQGLLARYADFAYIGAAARAEFGADLRRKNEFFAAAGALPPLDAATAARLEALGPAKALAGLRASAAQGRWRL